MGGTRPLMLIFVNVGVDMPMYDRSLVIFKNKRAVVRQDFEAHHVIPAMR